jgi:hypothetical protein
MGQHYVGETSSCPECGATWVEGQTCQDYFHQMLFWENEDPARGEVHHLMVLCYHLQHPSLYSVEGLAYSRGLLADFVERGLNTEEVRRRNRQQVASDNRPWSITARPGNQGHYEQPPVWTLTAEDVVDGGPDAYQSNVRQWACSIANSLREIA